MGDCGGMGGGCKGSNRAATVRKRMKFAPGPLPAGRGSVRFGRIRAGFTLAELMVSVAVLLILMTMVGWIFATATGASSKATANNELMGGVRAAQGQMAEDFGARIPRDGMGRPTFMGIWYQLTPDPRYSTSTPTRYLRTDRIVFYTLVDDMVRQDQPASMKISGPARVFYGHENGILKKMDVEQWTLARRQKILAPTLPAGYYTYPTSYVLPDDGIDASFKASNYSDQKKLWDGVSDLYDNWECEGGTLEDWRGVSIESYFAASGLMVENPVTATMSWIRRPIINTVNDITRQTGMQMCFLPGCAEFKVQRWIERDPLTGAPLGPNSGYGMPRWYPEEDVDGNGLVETVTTANDFAYMQAGMGGGSSALDIREYFNEPLPSTVSASGSLAWGLVAGAHSTPYVQGAEGRWLYYGEQDVPKALKVTVRLYDPNKRLEDGQVLTMTFGLTGTQQ